MGTFYQPEVADRDLSHCLKELSVDPDHLFRHLTEVNGKDTRVALAKIFLTATIVLTPREAILRASWSSKMIFWSHHLV